MNQRFGLSVNQSLYMYKRVEEITKIVDLLIRCGREEYTLLIDELYIILRNCYSTIESCTELTYDVNNKETFWEYVGDMNFWLDVVSGVLTQMSSRRKHA